MRSEHGIAELHGARGDGVQIAGARAGVEADMTDHGAGRDPGCREDDRARGPGAVGGIGLQPIAGQREDLGIPGQVPRDTGAQQVFSLAPVIAQGGLDEPRRHGAEAEAGGEDVVVAVGVRVQGSHAGG